MFLGPSLYKPFQSLLISPQRSKNVLSTIFFKWSGKCGSSVMSVSTIVAFGYSTTGNNVGQRTALSAFDLEMVRENPWNPLLNPLRLGSTWKHVEPRRRPSMKTLNKQHLSANHCNLNKQHEKLNGHIPIPKSMTSFQNHPPISTTIQNSLTVTYSTYRLPKYSPTPPLRYMSIPPKSTFIPPRWKLTKSPRMTKTCFSTKRKRRTILSANIFPLRPRMVFPRFCLKLPLIKSDMRSCQDSWKSQFTKYLNRFPGSQKKSPPLCPPSAFSPMACLLIPCLLRPLLKFIDLLNLNWQLIFYLSYPRTPLCPFLEQQPREMRLIIAFPQFFQTLKETEGLSFPSLVPSSTDS